MQKLKRLLRQVDGRGYKAYKKLEGEYEFPDFELTIEHVQADPFAPPSTLCAWVPQPRAGFPFELFKIRSRRIALEDYLTRVFWEEARRRSRRRGSGKSGLISILKPSQQVLQRSVMEVSEAGVKARFHVGLPARGRTIWGREAEEMLLKEVPAVVERSLFYRNLNGKDVEAHVKVAEDADFIRRQLRKRGLVAFVANGAMLPRRSGVDERPLPSGGVPFRSPPSLEVTFECPNRTLSGMGIPEGVTLIVGGAYHGKSTLLNALALGVYNHIPGDGREFVVTEEDAVLIRAEDGRFVERVDISSFISNLPNGSDTSSFSTENASGSTSQAANIVEALEAGSKLLLIDEDTSATNLMIRDRRIQELVSKDREPITPLIDVIERLKEQGVSAILIMGGLGDYFDVADTVIMMDAYRPCDVTGQAKRIAREHVSTRMREKPQRVKVAERAPKPNSIDPWVKGKIRIKAKGMDHLIFGRETIDLSRVEQLVEAAQVEAIGALLQTIPRSSGGKTLRELLDALERGLDRKGFSFLPRIGDYARPRKFEIAFALNRLRSLRCEQAGAKPIDQL